jgi:nicotinate-nucleotide adenylyltransferase
MDTIALFGGSFDPPHTGHEAIVEALLNFKDIDKVVVMPAFLNPFKSESHAPAELRLEWLKEIFNSFKNVEIDDYEINLKKKISTIQTVKYLLNKYKKIYLVIGADNLLSLHKWDRYDELKELVTFIVAPRDNIKIPDNFLKLDVNVNISSTKLRKNVQTSKIPHSISEKIVKYYKEQNEK